MLIDLHTHTLRHSFDSGLRPERLLALARERGLDGVCFTEHNAMWERGAADELEREYGVRVFRGMEISTDHGHVLVFGVEQFKVEMLYINRLREHVDRAGGVMILAHPMRASAARHNWSEAREVFDGIEVVNGTDSNGSTRYLHDLARDLGFAGIGGSDAHSHGSVGAAATRFERPVRDENELIAQVRAARVAAVHLNRRSAHRPVG